MLIFKNISAKQFQIIGFDVNIPPDDVFETFVEEADDLTMTTTCYLALSDRAKWILCRLFYYLHSKNLFPHQARN